MQLVINGLPGFKIFKRDQDKVKRSTHPYVKFIETFFKAVKQHVDLRFPGVCLMTSICKKAKEELHHIKKKITNKF